MPTQALIGYLKIRKGEPLTTSGHVVKAVELNYGFLTFLNQKEV